MKLFKLNLGVFFFYEAGQVINLCKTQSSSNLITLFQLSLISLSTLSSLPASTQGKVGASRPPLHTA